MAAKSFHEKCIRFIMLLMIYVLIITVYETVSQVEVNEIPSCLRSQAGIYDSESTNNYISEENKNKICGRLEKDKLLAVS